MEQSVMQGEAMQLSRFEQKIYLHLLLTKLETPRTTHEALTAKAYESILSCLRNDNRAQKQR